ncbi:MAG: biopolymer transporter ExbD [Candidatus Omnitrophica bacterium]|nr:biopolymer transporter ExbD [Candidatus Omnitrophota bacterium]
MKFKRRTTLQKGNLDIAPLIDVIFLLLIFFMLTSSFIFQPGIKVNLPKAVTSEVISKENLILVITLDNKIFLKERSLTEEELSSAVEIASKQKKPILIKADRRADFEQVVRIWDMCRDMGVENVNIATTQERK